MSIELDADFISEKNAETNKPIVLYQIDNYDDAAGVLRMVERRENVVFDGNTYFEFPIFHDDIGENAQGQVDEVRVKVSNISRVIQNYLELYDWRGKKVTITYVWEDTLSDPDAKIDFIYYIDSYTADEKVAEFSLLPKIDVLAVTLPNRIYSRNSCGWAFKSTECGYAGSEILCDKSFQRCGVLNNKERFGGFPSIPQRQVFGV